MTLPQKPPPYTAGEAKFTAVGDRKWTAPRRVEPFLDWLDEQHPGVDTEDSVRAFANEHPMARLMPASLRADLKSRGYL